MNAPHDPTAQPPLGLCVRTAPGRGRGVFATRAFAAGELLERAPAIVVPRVDLAPLRGTRLDDYWFWWDQDHNACALGWGSLYNHGCPANAAFRLLHATAQIEFVAVRAIAAGDEVTINYHGSPRDAAPVWFPTGSPDR